MFDDQVEISKVSLTLKQLDKSIFEFHWSVLILNGVTVILQYGPIQCLGYFCFKSVFDDQVEISKVSFALKQLINI